MGYVPRQFRAAPSKNTSGSIAARSRWPRNRRLCHDRRQRPRVPEHPRADQRARRGAGRHAAAGDRHLFGQLIELTESCLADLQGSSGPRAGPTSTPPTATAPGRRRSPTCSRAATTCWRSKRPVRRGWGEMAEDARRRGRGPAGRWRRAVDPAALEARLGANGRDIKALLVVQIDTASGVVNDIAAIRKAMDAARHPALLMVDGVASLGCMPFEMDGWGVDVAMSGSQKGLMTPPGLGFVAANDKARAAHKPAGLRTLYWDWTFREGEIHYQKYCGTPPEHLLFGLRKAIDMLHGGGLANVIRRHALLAEAMRARWPSGPRGVSSFNIANPPSAPTPSPAC